MKKFLGRTLMLIGAWVVVMAIVGTITALMSTESLPEHIVLEIDFEREFAEYVPDDPLASVLMERTASVRDIVDALQQAANDERVLALVARAGTPRMGLAEIQEVRDAVMYLSGKWQADHCLCRDLWRIRAWQWRVLSG